MKVKNPEGVRALAYAFIAALDRSLKADEKKERKKNESKS